MDNLINMYINTQRNNNMNYQQDKVDAHVERVNMAHSHFNEYKRSKWQLEGSLNTANKLQRTLEAAILKAAIQQDIVSNDNRKIELENNQQIEKTCAICLESLNNKTFVSTKCNHSFCYQCIEFNKQYNKCTGELCAICRSRIF
jgi:capsule polysaccharide export protein KpsE/RkpR